MAALLVTPLLRRRDDGEFQFCLGVDTELSSPVWESFCKHTQHDVTSLGVVLQNQTSMTSQLQNTITTSAMPYHRTIVGNVSVI